MVLANRAYWHCRGVMDEAYTQWIRDGVYLSFCEPPVQLSKTEGVFSRIFSALPGRGMKYEQLSLCTASRAVIYDNLFDIYSLSLPLSTAIKTSCLP